MQTQNSNTTTNKVWISGNDLVKKLDDSEVYDELYVSGYLAKLKRFIAEREAALAEQNKNNPCAKRQKAVDEEELGR